MAGPVLARLRSLASRFVSRDLPCPGGSTGGPISTQWNVRGWPTLYVLDGKGVIRHKYVGSPGGETLDKVIDELLEEMEKEKK